MNIIFHISFFQPNLLSSHRTLVQKLDCVELSQALSSTRREQVTLFVFSDSIEVNMERKLLLYNQLLIIT